MQNFFYKTFWFKKYFQYKTYLQNLLIQKNALVKTYLQNLLILSLLHASSVRSWSVRARWSIQTRARPE